MVKLDNFKDYLEYRDGRFYWIKKSSRGIRLNQQAGFSDKSQGYRKLTINGKQIGEHRLVFYYFNGYFPVGIDHINGIRSDNRIENLRECSQKENLQNKGMQKNNTSGHTGVYLNKRGQYYVQVVVNKKYKTIGTFKDFELACLVADEARDLYYGTFARINRGLFRGS